METLQTYLDTQYKQDCARRTEILRLVQHTLPLFTATFKTQGWPYECHAEVFPPSVDKLSATTVAMTAGALQQTANKGLPKSVFNLCTFHPSYNTVQEGQNAVEQVIRAATMCLMDKAPDVLYSSPTYGYKSVFVLSWLLELFENVPASLLEEAEKKPIFDDVVATSCEQLSEIFKAFGNKEQIPYNKDAPELASTKETPKIDSRHAFPLLKAIRLYFSLLNISDKPGLRPETKRRIEDICFPAALLENILISKIHHYISLSSFDNSQFDAAELAFSLESYLLVRKYQFSEKHKDSETPSFLCDKGLLNRIFSILAEQQKITAYWMPMSPVITHSNGFSLLPLSVEIVLSLQRLCVILGESGSQLFTAYSGIFERYLDWVKARLTVLREDNKQIYGWSSEHIYKPNTVHIWQSSQILIFLVQYYEALRKKISNDALAAANLTLSYPDPQDEELAKFWETQPYGSGSVHADIKRRIDDPSNRSQSVSFLLYGPPGTGKTYFAQQIAKQKQWPLLELSPSDFIADGVDKLENKAKNLFAVLYEQRDIVILFDEIDRLLLNRDSADYKGQGDMFQVMVASLLVKFKKLRDTPHIIFLICTNYKHRLDPAIIRPGRIDKHVLVLPPHRDGRKEYIDNYIAKEHLTLPVSSGTIADKTPLFSFGELNLLTKECSAIKSGDDAAIDALVKEHMPTISLASYLQHITFYRGTGESKIETLFPANELPLDEILMVAYALHEADRLLCQTNQTAKLAELLKETEYRERGLDAICAVLGKEVQEKVQSMVETICNPKIESD